MSWTKDQVERTVRTAFFVKNKNVINLDVEHCDHHNIAQIIRWANENGWHAVETNIETVEITKHKEPAELKPFKITLEFDGKNLTVNYHDGSDIETYSMKTTEDIKSSAAMAIDTALSEEEGEGKDES